MLETLYRPNLREIPPYFKESVVLLRNLVRDRMIATWAPTTPWGARYVASKIPKPSFLGVEYGPGTGAVTRPLLDAMGSNGTLIALETNPNFVEHLKTIDDDRLHIHQASAEESEGILDGKKANFIVSGIPFSRGFLSPDTVDRIWRATMHTLDEHGVFIAYQVRNAVRRPLHRLFGNVQEELYWWNMFPPLYIYRAQGKKPITESLAA
ncbi:hypothetical protein HY285_03305 [Candidatus Peregrinibacteria bacterium]|nr:hypothetical protein [Candidatus Peregrinibacteria bacterium]MBI3816543.1 hypothetical protein [Candidatus Peregrinibacteria bacterium]